MEASNYVMQDYVLLCFIFFAIFVIFSFAFSSLEGLFEKHDPWLMLRIIGYNALIFLIIPALCYLFCKYAI